MIINKNMIRKASSRNLKTAAVIFIAALSAGCSSGMERFTDSFYSSAVPNSSDASSNAQIYQTAQSSSGAVVSSQLPPPPAQTSYSSQQTYPTQTYPSQPAASGQTLGAPPQNLGTIPASASVNTPVAPVAQQARYTVQTGDTLYSISQRSGVSVDTIKSANNIPNGVIHVGQTLTIPGANTVASRSPSSSSTPSQPQKTAPKSPVVVANTNNAGQSTNQTPPTQIAAAPTVATTPPAQSTTNTQTASVAPQATGIAKLRWPAQGRILSSFGQNQNGSVNDGIDIMVPEGASVRAAENGVVIDAVKGLKKFGDTVLIRHENNIVTVYGHNSKIFVQRGQKVRRGDEIAKSGMSGDAATPRVHFEVRKNAAPVNPIDYLEN